MEFIHFDGVCMPKSLMKQEICRTAILSLYAEYSEDGASVSNAGGEMTVIYNHVDSKPSRDGSVEAISRFPGYPVKSLVITVR